jgi:putative oxidoreductase
MNKDNLFNLSMFALRVVIGIIFVAHGAQKLFGTFDGVGLEGTAKMVEGMGFSNAYVIGVVWACIEFVGGISLILGILARWSALAISLTMVVRLWKVNLMYGFFIQNGGIEYGLLIIGACLPLIFMGGGSWSVWDV